jgi:hypothetical protein
MMFEMERARHRRVVLGAHGKGIAVVALAGLGLLSLILALIGPFSGFDFENAYMGAARAVADGHSPYPPTGAWEIAHDRAYVYPPTLAVLLAPFTLISLTLATHLVTLFCIGAVGASLWLAGVRDARVYFVVYLWAPVFAGIQNLNASLLVMLLVALAWRYREHALAGGLAAGLAIAVKLFVWPLVIWFVATRRFRAAAISAASGALMIALSWAVIGFEGVGRYPRLLDELTALRLDVSHSVASISMGLGASRSIGTMIALLVGAVLALAAVRAGRRGDDAACLMLALTAGLAIIPIVWQHHLLVLVVPLAVLRPRLSWVWFLMLPPWICMISGYGMLWNQVIPTLCAGIIVFTVAGPSLRRSTMPQPATA